MISFVLTMLLGIGQFFILKEVLSNALGGKPIKMFLMLLLKFALYGAVISLVFLVLKENVYLSAAGFCVGLPGAVAVYAIKHFLFSDKKLHGKGDENIESVDDN